jgi:hypothetical protein
MVRDDHCQMVTCRRCLFVPEEKCVRIPYTTCKMVREDHCQMVTCRRCLYVPEEKCVRIPYTTCKMVPEERSQVIRCRRCKYVPEERCCQVPYTTCKMIPEERCYQVPVVTCTLEAYTVKRPVCRLIPIVEPVCVPLLCPPPDPCLPLGQGPRMSTAVSLVGHDVKKRN